MDEHDWLAERFEENRNHLRAVAYRMLGSPSEADDAVQEAWIRLSRSGTDGVENLGGWLTTIVARVSLDMLRSRTARREEAFGPHVPEPVVGRGAAGDPEHQALMADAVGPALLVVLEMLSPAERLAFVLHDMFSVSFDEIAPIVGRTPTAARQLASRARRRVQGAATDVDEVDGIDRARQRTIVGAFLAASRDGDFDALLALLDPEIVARADEAAARSGAVREARGPRAVAEVFLGRAKAAEPALLGGVPGLAWAPGGEPRVVFAFTFANDRIATIDLIAAPDRIRELAPILG